MTRVNDIHGHQPPIRRRRRVLATAAGVATLALGALAASAVGASDLAPTVESIASGLTSGTVRPVPPGDDWPWKADAIRQVLLDDWPWLRL